MANDKPSGAIAEQSKLVDNHGHAPHGGAFFGLGSMVLAHGGGHFPNGASLAESAVFGRGK